MRAFTPSTFLAVTALVTMSACGGEADCGFDLALVHDPGGDVLQLTADDGAVCARVVRHPDLDPGVICKACPYDLQEVTVQVDDEAERVDDDARLRYVPSHHNWADRALVVVAAGVAEIALNYERLADDSYGFTYGLTVFDVDTLDDAEAARDAEDGAGPPILVGPLVLKPTAPLQP